MFRWTSLCQAWKIATLKRNLRSNKSALKPASTSRTFSGLKAGAIESRRFHPPAMEAPLVVGEGGDRHPLGARGDGGAGRRLRHVVAVAHPHAQPRRRAGWVIQPFDKAVGGNQRPP